jgi:hypothetical protein
MRTITVKTGELLREHWTYVENIPTGDDVKSRQLRTRIFEALSLGAIYVSLNMDEDFLRIILSPPRFIGSYRTEELRAAALRRVEGIIKEIEG